METAKICNIKKAQFCFKNELNNFFSPLVSFTNTPRGFDVAREFLYFKTHSFFFFFFLLLMLSSSWHRGSEVPALITSLFFDEESRSWQQEREPSILLLSLSLFLYKVTKHREA